MINTLAYHGVELFTAVKGLMAQALGGSETRNEGESRANTQTKLRFVRFYNFCNYTSDIFLKMKKGRSGREKRFLKLRKMKN